jgi:cytoskeletal protein RodZ
VDRGGHARRVDSGPKPDRTPAQASDRDDYVEPGRSVGDSADATPGADAEEPSTAELTGPQLLGRRLAMARRHAGLSVEAVADVTRIRATMIRHMESGDFSRCGGEVYARGHVRALARVAGIDPEPLLSEQPSLVTAESLSPRPAGSASSSASSSSSGSAFASARSAAAPPGAGHARARVIRPAAPRTEPAASTLSTTFPPVVAGARRKEKGDVIGRQPKSANWTAAMSVVLLGLVVFGGMQLAGEDKTTSAAAAHVPPPPKPKPAAPAPPPVVVPTGVAMRVAAVGADSWLDVTSADGRTLFDNLLPSGSTQTFQDSHQLGVTLGNAAAVHLQLNGKDLGPAGGNGQVVHLTVEPGGVVNG